MTFYCCLAFRINLSLHFSCLEQSLFSFPLASQFEEAWPDTFATTRNSSREDWQAVARPHQTPTQPAHPAPHHQVARLRGHQNSQPISREQRCQPSLRFDGKAATNVGHGQVVLWYSSYKSMWNLFYFYTNLILSYVRMGQKNTPFSHCFYFKAQRDWSIFRGHRKAVFQRQWKGRSSTAAAIPTSPVSPPFHIQKIFLTTWDQSITLAIPLYIYREQLRHQNTIVQMAKFDAAKTKHSKDLLQPPDKSLYDITR